eukprot:CAMPEP_0184029576 /NCGR_PEP_ID=MMETSP0955-20130417/636_1 /TAXON_ID=627963 /ORGANISM="Aplanochytrium sp, Strain PBS07" /LENGTH=66 /DNA_ID=CAMNT_0026314671 /DNA_START=294 /DNA_END=494 /DNA_ORIENTATION=-
MDEELELTLVKDEINRLESAQSPQDAAAAMTQEVMARFPADKLAAGSTKADNPYLQSQKQGGGGCC